MQFLLDWQLWVPVLLTAFFVWLVVMICRNMMREQEAVPGESHWIAQKGKVVTDEVDFRRGVGLSVKPVDAVIQRLDLGSYTVRVRRENIHFFRMRVHLVMDTGLYFEMVPKERGLGGRVFEIGEGMIEVEAIDDRFWTETSMLKEVQNVLMDRRVQKRLAKVQELSKLEVKGDLIELIFPRRVYLLEPMYQLAHELARRVENY